MTNTKNNIASITLTNIFAHTHNVPLHSEISSLSMTYICCIGK